jgi:hypothetical protein
MNELATLRRQLRERQDSSALLPLGTPGVTTRWRSRSYRRRNARRTAYVATVLITVAGVYLATIAAGTSISMTASSYRVGASVLQAQGGGRYVGDGALIIEPEQNGIVRAGGSAVVSGETQSGVCYLSRGQGQERCIFSVGSASVSAVDTWTGSGWSRRYDDGKRATIPANTIAPVPFEVGR